MAGVAAALTIQPPARGTEAWRPRLPRRTVRTHSPLRPILILASSLLARVVRPDTGADVRSAPLPFAQGGASYVPTPYHMRCGGTQAVGSPPKGCSGAIIIQHEQAP